MGKRHFIWGGGKRVGGKGGDVRKGVRRRREKKEGKGVRRG